MAENSKIDDAEQAYAAAALNAKPAKAAEKAAAPAKVAEHAKAHDPKSAAPAKVAESAKVAEPAKAHEPKAGGHKPAAGAKAIKPAAKAVKAKPAKVKPAKAVPAKKPPVRKPAAKAAPAPVKHAITAKPVRRTPMAPVKPSPTLSHWKEAIMTTTTKTTDYTKPIADAFGEMQTRAKVAYDKSAVALTDASDFAKGNVEAIVESSKIVAAGVQNLSRTYVEEAKSAYETVTGDVKELAAVKSPTELFQLQGKIARRNFDALVSTSSKNTDAFIKLATDAFAPLTGRVNLAAEKLAKVA